MADEQKSDSLTENKDVSEESSPTKTEDVSGKSSPADVKDSSPKETNTPESMEEAIMDGLKDSLEGEGILHTDDEEVPDEVPEIDSKADAEQKTETTEQKADEEEDDPYKIPDGLKPEASERFSSLVNDNKEMKTKFDEQEVHLTNVRQMFEKTGASREEFGKIFDYVTIRNTSKDPKDLQECLDFVKNEVKALEDAMGIVDESKLLDTFPDLKKEVDKRGA